MIPLSSDYHSSVYKPPPAPPFPTTSTSDFNTVSSTFKSLSSLHNGNGNGYGGRSRSNDQSIRSNNSDDAFGFSSRSNNSSGLIDRSRGRDMRDDESDWGEQVDLKVLNLATNEIYYIDEQLGGFEDLVELDVSPTFSR